MVASCEVGRADRNDLSVRVVACSASGACLGIFLGLWAGAVALAADPLAVPQGPVILSISGNIEVTNAADRADFDREMLIDIGIREIHTTTTWTEGVQVFEGTLLRDVLDRVGASGMQIVATALNDFKSTLPMDEVERYDVLLALKANGTEMQVSDKGPIWIVYPRDAHPELQDEKFNDRWVWQLRELRVE